MCYSQLHVKSRLLFFIQTLNSLFSSSFRLPLSTAHECADRLEISEKQQRQRQDAQRTAKSDHAGEGLTFTCDLDNIVVAVLFHYSRVQSIAATNIGRNTHATTAAIIGALGFVALVPTPSVLASVLATR